MEITTTQEGSTATIALDGKLSVATSPDLDAAIAGLPESVTSFVIDLAKLDYISSAGLRVLVSTEKLAARRGGSLVLQHPNEEVGEVFEMTGLSEVFTIEA